MYSVSPNFIVVGFKPKITDKVLKQKKVSRTATNLSEPSSFLTKKSLISFLLLVQGAHIDHLLDSLGQTSGYFRSCDCRFLIRSLNHPKPNITTYE